MSLYLSENDVRHVLTLPMALEAVESVLGAHGRGEAIDLPRARTRVPGMTMHMLQGAVPGLGVAGYKVYSTSREGARFLVHLYDIATGRPEAVIAADYLGMMRTGAAGGVAAKWLARPDAAAAVVFGSGWQAQSQVEALCQVRDIRRVQVVARDADKLRAFCTELSARTGREVVPAGDVPAAVAAADVVVTITSSATPVLQGAWLSPGTHVTAAGCNALIRRELDEEAVRRCSLVSVDSRAVALREVGDLLPALEKGHLHEGRLVEIGQIVAGCRPGRRAGEDITLFESQGMAIQDLAVAHRVLQRVRSRGLGVSLPF
ncbi:MAG: ornithine cyclodeaminase family protein [Betaproteobacteria bacterium]|nr:ornithine cyclodeaminase family protein [Betaproteobacteria bacterium]